MSVRRMRGHQSTEGGVPRVSWRMVSARRWRGRSPASTGGRCQCLLYVYIYNNMYVTFWLKAEGFNPLFPTHPPRKRVGYHAWEGSPAWGWPPTVQEEGKGPRWL